MAFHCFLIFLHSSHTNHYDCNYKCNRNRASFYLSLSFSLSLSLSSPPPRVGLDGQQFVGWAYLSWSILRVVGIIRRYRQRCVRKIQRVDPNGTANIEARIAESLEDEKQDDESSPLREDILEPKTKKRKPFRRPSSSSNNSSNEGVVGDANVVRQRFNGKSPDEPPRRTRKGSKTALHINFSMESATKSSPGHATPSVASRGTSSLQRRHTPPMINQTKAYQARTQSSKKEKSSPVPNNLLTALLLHNTHRIIAMVLLIMIILPLYPIIFDTAHTMSNDIATVLQRINTLYPDPSQCPELQRAITWWFFSYIYPIAVPNWIPRSYNGNRLEFVLSAAITPNRCPFQVGQFGTFAISACTPDFSPRLGRFSPPPSPIANITYCNSTVMPPFDAAQAAYDGNQYFKELTGGTTIRNSAVKSISCSGGYPYAALSETTCKTEEGTSFYMAPPTSDPHSTVIFNFTAVLSFGSMLILVSRSLLLVVIWFAMVLLQRDAKVLVIRPLTRLLDIVFYYVRNPLAPTRGSSVGLRETTSLWRNTSWFVKRTEFGKARTDEYFETEQLVGTISKIAEMLKKCWGVAGATIISESISSVTVKELGEGKECFDPSRGYGRSIYAIFAFVEICDFDHLISSLKEDVINIINDIAVVVHEEVKRWGYVSSGQCNKNMGATFLMVWKIGDQERVMAEYAKATTSVFEKSNEGGDQDGDDNDDSDDNRSDNETDFSEPLLGGGSTRRTSFGSESSGVSQTFEPDYRAKQGGFSIAPGGSRYGPSEARQRYRNRHNLMTSTLQLSSLPGISKFAERAVVGILKAFARIHRDRAILSWKNSPKMIDKSGVKKDVNIAVGMSAGWAIEGAVGSSQKVDATYLSPHVNNAARLTTACGQYGLPLLLNGSVQELFSSGSKEVLRHVDNVYVKGSKEEQRLYTYDSKHKGVPFFMMGRSEKASNREADVFSENTWRMDADLLAMRRHITPAFLEEFNRGRTLYMKGQWEDAIESLEKANKIMVATHDEGGWEEDDDEEGVGETPGGAVKDHWNDGVCLALIDYMKRAGPVKKEEWKGCRPIPKR